MVGIFFLPADAGPGGESGLLFHADVRRRETGRLVCTLNGTAPGTREDIGTIVTGRWTCGETMETFQMERVR